MLRNVQMKKYRRTRGSSVPPANVVYQDGHTQNASRLVVSLTRVRSLDVDSYSGYA